MPPSSYMDADTVIYVFLFFSFIFGLVFFSTSSQKLPVFCSLQLELLVHFNWNWALATREGVRQPRRSTAQASTSRTMDGTGSPSISAKDQSLTTWYSHAKLWNHPAPPGAGTWATP